MLFSSGKQSSPAQKVPQLTQHTRLLTLQSVAALRLILNRISEENHVRGQKNISDPEWAQTCV